MLKYFKERGNKLYRLLDRYVGIPLVLITGLGPNRSTAIPASINRIALMKTGAIGDTILLDAVSKDIRKTWPQAKLTFFAGRDNYRVIDMLSEIDEVIALPMNRPWIAAKRIFNSGRFDLWFDFSQWARIDALFTMVARASLKIGFRTTGQYRHYGYDIDVKHRDDVHEIHNFRDLVNIVGVRSQTLPALRENSNSGNEIAISRLPVPYLIFHMFPGGSRAYMKEWPKENWVELTQYCLDKGWAVVLTGGLADFPRAQEFADNEELQGREAVINLAGRSPLKLLPTLLAKSGLVISVNTGVMHMAAAVGAQLIAIHGPTSPLRWGPLSPTATIIKPENMACSPCLNLGFEYKCDQNYCLQSISPKVVINALEKLLTW